MPSQNFRRLSYIKMVESVRFKIRIFNQDVLQRYSNIAANNSAEDLEERIFVAVLKLTQLQEFS